MTPGQRQTLIDVAVECNGMAEAAWDIAIHNGIGLTDNVAGVNLNVPCVNTDIDTVEALKAAGAKPACEGSISSDEHLPIGQSQIGRDAIR